MLGTKLSLDKKFLKTRKTLVVFLRHLAAGEVVELNRGDKRAFQSLVIKVDDNEEQVEFSSYESKEPHSWNGTDLRKLLVETGLWPALRQRPF